MDVVDFSLLEELYGVMADDFQGLIETFELDTRQRFELLEQAFERRDGDAFRSTAHTMKGSALGIGALKLSREFKTLEDAGRVGEFSGVDVKIDGARHCFEQTLLQVNDWLEETWKHHLC